MAKTMQAVRYAARGDPNVLKWEDVPVTAPGPGELLIRMHYAGLNIVDSHLRSGRYPFLQVPLPAIPGKDGAGLVEAIGSDAASFKKGDRVWIGLHGLRQNGLYAEYQVVREEEVHLLPDDYSLQEGAALGSSCYTAARALFLVAKAKPGETVLIHGASGAVGLASMQLAVDYGLQVYGTAGTDEGLQEVLKLGAIKVYNHREKNYVAQMKEDIGPKGFAIILEMVADKNMQTDLELAGPKCRLIIIGSHGSVSIKPELILAKEITVMGVKLSDSTVHQWKEMSDLLQEKLEKGILRPKLNKEYGRDEVVKAHEVLDADQSGSQGRNILRLV